jgi:hypothetical protein
VSAWAARRQEAEPQPAEEPEVLPHWAREEPQELLRPPVIRNPRRAVSEGERPSSLHPAAA